MYMYIMCRSRAVQNLKFSLPVLKFTFQLQMEYLYTCVHLFYSKLQVVHVIVIVEGTWVYPEVVCTVGHTLYFVLLAVFCSATRFPPTLDVCKPVASYAKHSTTKLRLSFQELIVVHHCSSFSPQKRTKTTTNSLRKIRT